MRGDHIEQRLRAAGVETTGVEDATCCYAEKTETWTPAEYRSAGIASRGISGGGEWAR